MSVMGSTTSFGSATARRATGRTWQTATFPPEGDDGPLTMVRFRRRSSRGQAHPARRHRWIGVGRHPLYRPQRRARLVQPVWQRFFRIHQHRRIPLRRPAENVQTTDLLGTGTAYLVWSSPLPASSSVPMRYVDLMGGIKPHLLTAVRDNLGGESRVSYAPSTRFYLQDEAAGKPWVTRLPFPIWTVARVETFDWIGRNRRRCATPIITGSATASNASSVVSAWLSNGTPNSFAPTKLSPRATSTTGIGRSGRRPLTLTWFSTGAFVQAGAVTQQYEGDYWLESPLRGPPRATSKTTKP